MPICNFRTQYLPTNVTGGISFFFVNFLCHFYACPVSFCRADQCSSRAIPKFWGRAKNLEGVKSFYFRLTTVFFLGYRLSKHKMTRYSKNLRGHGPWTSPSYACGPVFVLIIIHFFDIQQVAFSRLDKFENIFWIVVEGCFCSGNISASVGNGENAIWSKCLWLLNALVKKSYLSSWVFTAMQSIHIRTNLSLSLLLKYPGSTYDMVR